jgi:hypothetical protein
MIVNPTFGPTASQNSRSILNWLLDKAAGTAASKHFSGHLAHEAVAELVKVIKGLPRVERTESATEYRYQFLLVSTIKGRFDISISRDEGRRPGDKYQVELKYQAVSVEELLAL